MMNDYDEQNPEEQIIDENQLGDFSMDIEQPNEGGLVYTEQDYCRPALSSTFTDNSKDIYFMQVDIDNYIYKGGDNVERAVIRMFGVNMEGNSILAHIH